MTTDAEPILCNLDARGNRTRARVGAVLAVVTIAIAAAVIASDASAWWALAAFLPAYGAAIGFLQAKAST